MELGILQSSSKGQRGQLEIGIGKPCAFPIAVGFNQASLVGEAVESFVKRSA